MQVAKMLHVLPSQVDEIPMHDLVGLVALGSIENDEHEAAMGRGSTQSGRRTEVTKYRKARAVPARKPERK